MTVWVAVIRKCLSALRQYLENESLDKKKQTYDTSDWKLESVKNIPQQMNGSDCGVFSCMFAEYICSNKRITFTQQDMPYFRNKMVYEILKSKAFIERQTDIHLSIDDKQAK